MHSPGTCRASKVSDYDVTVRCHRDPQGYGVSFATLNCSGAGMQGKGDWPDEYEEGGQGD